jgi:hypothetical protein
VAARACGVGSRKGRLAPGFDADILAVAGDPTTGVRTLWRCERCFAPADGFDLCLLLQLADVHGLESRGIERWRLLVAMPMSLWGAGARRTSSAGAQGLNASTRVVAWLGLLP